MLITWVLLIGLLLADGAETTPTVDEQNGFLSLYPATLAVENASFQSEYWEPTGEKMRLVVSERSPIEAAAGRSFPLPFPASQVAWAGLLPRSLADRLAGGVVVEGEPLDSKGQPLRVDDVSPLVDHDGPRDIALPSQASAPRELPRSGWIWRPSAWQEEPEALFEKLAAWSMRKVYVTVPANSEGVETPDQLGSFIEEAGRRGIAVWCVDGDRYALLPEQQESFLIRARAYAAYNRDSQPSRRLAGLQYDIEPYLMPGYALHAEQWNEAYVQLLARLRDAASMPLEVALPFWFQGQKSGDGMFLQRVAAVIDGIVVMDYRTDRSEILHLATPFLRWGEEHHKSVTVALETVELPNARVSIYRPSRTGTLWLRLEGELCTLFLLKTPIAMEASPLQEGQLFAFSHGTLSSSSKTTFFGKEEQLRDWLPELEQQLAAWPSFSGMAVHGTE